MKSTVNKLGNDLQTVTELHEETLQEKESVTQESARER